MADYDKPLPRPELPDLPSRFGTRRDPEMQVPYTDRPPHKSLAQPATFSQASNPELRGRIESHAAPGINSLTAVGDCLTPGLVSEAVFSAHEAARGLDALDVSDLPFRVEQVPASFEPAPHR